jgi:hypothetical protein
MHKPNALQMVVVEYAAGIFGQMVLLDLSVVDYG